jgi:hypothetical protein
LTLRRKTLIFVALLLAAAAAWAQSSPLQPGQFSSLALPLQNPPSQVTGVSVSLVGNPGPATLYFWIVSNYPMGNSAPAGPFILNQAPNSLASDDYASLTWQPALGATSYDVLLTSSPTVPSGACACAAHTAVANSSSTVTTNTTSAYTVTGVDPNAFTVTSTNFSAGSNLSALNWTLPDNTVLSRMDTRGNFRSLSITPKPTTVADLVNRATGGAGTMATVSDGLGDTDCSAGGGTTQVQCILQPDGTWLAIKSGGAGGNINPGLQYQLMYYASASSTGSPDPNTSSTPTQLVSTHSGGIHSLNGFYSDDTADVGVLTLNNPSVASFTMGATGVASNWGWNPPHNDAAGPLRLSGSLGGDGRDTMTVGLQAADLAAFINGTADTLAKFTAANVVGNSSVLDNGPTRRRRRMASTV